MPVSISSTAFASAQSTWKEVADNTKYLDNLIAQKKLSEVHEAAFNVRDSVRELKSGSTRLTPAAQKQLATLTAQIDEIAGDMDETGDKNDLRGTIANQRKLHVALDQIAALYPKGTVKAIGAITANAPVKDPVCRMTVDPATASGRVAYAGQTYYFCSKGDAEAFRKSPAKYAALYEQIAFGKPKTFAVSLQTQGATRAGKPEPLIFAVREQGSPQIVKSFQLVHEKLMHLIVVSDDLSYFSHEHPQIGQDGKFRLNSTFPRAGRYFLFSDFTPDGGLNQIQRTQIVVDGAKPKALPRLVADKTLTKTVDGYTISVKPNMKLQAGKTVLMTYDISKNGKPVTDMDLYLGANGHMMAINQNGRDIVHTHTVSAGGAVSPAMATPRGPRFTYELTLPVGGLTKIWAQFRRGNQVLTVPFVFKVAAGQAAPRAKGKSDGHDDGHDHGAMTAQTTRNVSNNAQKITISLPEGYKDGAATVQAGKPVALTFKLTSNAGCGNTVVVPDANNWSKTLEVGQSATVVYTPKKSGTLAFMCGMNMMKGAIVVQ